MLAVIIWFVLKTLNGGVLLFDDGFFPFNPKLSFIQNISSWNNPFFPGGPYLGNFYYMPLIIFIGFFRILGFSYSNSEAAYLVLNLFIGSMGIYLLSKFITLHYIFKKSVTNAGLFFGSTLASLYYIFNYQQMNYYGGEFYTGFILINFTPILLYLIIRYLGSPVKYGFWNSYLGFLFLVSLISSAGLNGMDTVGTDLVWFSALVIFSLLLAKFMNNNTIISKHFFKKSLAIISAIVFSSAWIAQSVYYGAKESLVYGKTTYLANGKPLLTYSGFSSALKNLYSILTSGYYGLGAGGPGKIWYSPGQFLTSHQPLVYFTIAPVLLSFFFIAFLKVKWLRRINLVLIFVLTIIFYLFASRFINLVSFAYSNNFLLAGLNFSMTFEYSIYAFTVITAISLAISINILQEYLQKFNDSKQWRFRIRTEPTKHPNLTKIIILLARLSSKTLHPVSRKTGRNQKFKGMKRLHKGKIAYYGSLFIVFILVILYVTPIVNNPLMNWQYGNEPPITGVFKPDKSFLDVGNFLSVNSPYNNVLYLPVTVSPFATMYNNSSLMIVTPPFSFFTDGLGISSDPGSVNDTFAFPIMKMIPDQSITHFSNFLRLLGIKYVILNTAQYPTWVSASPSEFAGGGPPWNFSAFFSYLNSSSGIKLVRTFGPYDIFQVSNMLPLVYLSSGVKPMNSSSLTPTSIFDLYANGHLNAGEQSIINSTNVIEPGYNIVQSTSVLTSSFESVEKYQFQISLSNYSSKQNGYYEQEITISNYSRFGINSNASNFYIQGNNGANLYSWIQNQNSSSITLWVKVPFNMAALYLDVLPKSMNILSSKGYIGNTNLFTDNINLVFPSYLTNYNFSGGKLFSNNYFGFGFVMKAINSMNLTRTPFIQIDSQNNGWDPWWEFHSSTNSTNSAVSTLLGLTNTPIRALRYGYAYIYYNNTTSQNTVEATNGQVQTYSGNDGQISTSFIVNGGRGINLTLADAFQFETPSSGMPKYNISLEGETIDPIFVNLTGRQEVKANNTYTYHATVTENGEPLSKSQTTTFLRNSHVFVYENSKVKNEIDNFYIVNSTEIAFNVSFLSAGKYSIVFDSQFRYENITSGLSVQSYDVLPSATCVSFTIVGPNIIVPDRTYMYILSAKYSNGTPLNLQDSYSVYKNLTVEAENYNGSIFSITNYTFSHGKIYLQVVSSKSGSSTFFIMSHFYSGTTPGEVNFLRISNTHYVVTVRANSSGYLILNQAFSSGWVASSNGNVFYGHYMANGFSNAWLVPKGNYTIEIYFEPQKNQNILNLITMTATTIVIIALACDALYQLFEKKRDLSGRRHRHD